MKSVHWTEVRSDAVSLICVPLQNRRKQRSSRQEHTEMVDGKVGVCGDEGAHGEQEDVWAAHLTSWLMMLVSRNTTDHYLSERFYFPLLIKLELFCSFRTVFETNLCSFHVSMNTVWISPVHTWRQFVVFLLFLIVTSIQRVHSLWEDLSWSAFEHSLK